MVSCGQRQWGCEAVGVSPFGPLSTLISFLLRVHGAGFDLGVIFEGRPGLMVRPGRRGGTYFEGIIDNVAAGTPIMKSNGKSRMKEDYYV